MQFWGFEWFYAKFMLGWRLAFPLSLFILSCTLWFIWYNFYSVIMGSLSNIEFGQTSVKGNATKAKTNIDSKNKKESTRAVIIINEIYTGWQTIEYFSRQTNIYRRCCARVRAHANNRDWPVRGKYLFWLLIGDELKDPLLKDIHVAFHGNSHQF